MEVYVDDASDDAVDNTMEEGNVTSQHCRSHI